ncbi:MAG: hypothetical protein FWH12_03510 [Treponema sp.]|nr:hypothetical protein [Treponema sp.]
MIVSIARVSGHRQPRGLLVPWAMSLFSFLWMPLFYLFWRSLTGTNEAAGGVWGLLVGSIVALVHFFLGDLVDPGGFGFSRWAHAWVDVIALPVLLPLLIYLLLVLLRVIGGTINFANFTLLWLIPGGVIKAASWSSLNDPSLLILVPILWTAIAVGVPFFINIIMNSQPLVIVFASLGVLVVPLAAASSYWAFFSQRQLMGALFLAAAAIPLLVSMVFSGLSAGD